MIFVDANVLLDFFLGRDPYAQEALQLFYLAHLKEVEMGISSLSVSHCFYFTQKHLNTKDAYLVVEKVNKLFAIKTTAAKHVQKALELKWEDFEDGLQYAIAKECAAELIVSRDKSGFKKSDIPIASPKEAALHFSG